MFSARRRRGEASPTNPRKRAIGRREEGLAAALVTKGYDSLFGQLLHWAPVSSAPSRQCLQNRLGGLPNALKEVRPSLSSTLPPKPPQRPSSP